MGVVRTDCQVVWAAANRLGKLNGAHLLVAQTLTRIATVAILPEHPPRRPGSHTCRQQDETRQRCRVAGRCGVCAIGRARPHPATNMLVTSNL